MGQRSRSFAERGRGAFTLIDVLVTMAVVAVLISLLAPGLSKVREAARRVVCSSNLRQVGLGLALYADANRDALPPSVFLDRRQRSDNEVGYSPQSMMFLRVPRQVGRRIGTTWDGLGWLYATGVLPSPEIFYCPSHHGDHPFDQYSEQWLKQRDTIVGNYHYRGQGPQGGNRLSFIEPSRSAIAADALRTLSDFNHRIGLNVLRADLSLSWLPDSGGLIAEYLQDAAAEGYEDLEFDALWLQFDDPDDETILRDGR